MAIEREVSSDLDACGNALCVWIREGEIQYYKSKERIYIHFSCPVIVGLRKWFFLLFFFQVSCEGTEYCTSVFVCSTSAIFAQLSTCLAKNPETVTGRAFSGGTVYVRATDENRIVSHLHLTRFVFFPSHFRPPQNRFPLTSLFTQDSKQKKMHTAYCKHYFCTCFQIVLCLSAIYITLPRACNCCISILMWHLFLYHTMLCHLIKKKKIWELLFRMLRH